VEGTIVPRSRPFWVRYERSGRTPNPWPVFDSVEDMIDGHSEWDEVKICFVSIVGFGSTPGWLMDNRGVMAQILPRGNYGFGLSPSGPCLRGRLDVA